MPNSGVIEDQSSDNIFVCSQTYEIFDKLHVFILFYENDSLMHAYTLCTCVHINFMYLV